MSFSRTLRIIAILAIFAALFAVVPVSAQVGPPPTVASITANPTTVPFDPTPGKPGFTQVTLTVNISPGQQVFLCVSDNGAPYVAVLGSPANASGTQVLAVPAPGFPIQAGTYRFGAFLSVGAANAQGQLPCSGQLGAGAGSIVTVGRAGPTGLVGVDDVTLTVSAATVPSPAIVIAGITLPPGQDITIAPTTAFPINAQYCFMSGNGTQKQINLQEGQDPRVSTGVLIGGPLLGGITLTGALVNQRVAQAGQNGCYAENYIVEGFYNFGLAPTGSAGSPIPGAPQGSLAQFVGFCSPANPPNLVNPNPLDLSRHCAQVAYTATSGATILPLGIAGDTFAGRIPFPQGTVISGAATTGGDRHAIQVCAYAVIPTGPTTQTVLNFGNVAQSYNQSGSINITPLPLSAGAIAGLVPGAVVLLQTLDLSGPAGNGQGAPQQACAGLGILPVPVAGVVQAFTSPIIGLNAQVLDERFFLVV